MKPEDILDRQALEIFNRAMEMPNAEARRYFVEGACSGDRRLKARVEALLAHDVQVSSLNHPARELLLTEVVPDLAPSEKPGDRIGRYKLLQEIAEGGCGVVYMAEQEEPVHRRVALKVIKVGMDTKSVVARFEAERQALALMDHPNIAKVLDAGATETGRPYFVMELVRGIRITDFCNRNNLSTRERLDLFIQVCHAIQHAHQKGIIHRDIKPSNILVTINDPGSSGVPKVIDFGIAKATSQQRLTDKTLFTAFGQFIGTPAYMSPEQAEMTGLDIDTRSDVYALGVLLYELMTGKTPFDAKTLLEAGLDEMRRVIREQEPVRPSTRLTQELKATEVRKSESKPPTEEEAKSSLRLQQLKELIPILRGDLDWIVMKCLEKDRRRRYETADGLAKDIERHLSHEPVTARPPSAAYRAQKFVRRNKLTVTTGAAVAAALVLGVVVSIWQMHRAEANEQIAIAAQANEAKQRQAAEQAQRQAEADKLLARQNAYAADMNLAQQALAANDLGRARRLLDAHRPQPGEADLRGWEWRYLWQECQSDAMVELHKFPNSVYAAAFSADGNLLALAGLADRFVEVWDPKQGRRVAALQPASGQVVAFSPKGDFMAADGDDGKVNLYKAGTLNLVTEFSHGKGVADLRFSPDGDLLAIFSLGQGVAVRSLAGETNIWTFSAEQSGAHIGVVDFSPDNRCLAVGDAGGSLRAFSLETGEELFKIQAHGEGVSAVAWSPATNIIASGSAFHGGAVRLWDGSSGAAVGTLEGHTSWICRLVFSLDGQFLYSASADQTIRIWDVSEQRCLAVLRGNMDEVYGLALSPDGKTLASCSKDGVVALWDATPKPRDKGVASVGANYRWLAFAPNAPLLATVAADGVTLRNRRDLTAIRTLSALGTNIATIAYSCDGALLAVGYLDGKARVWAMPQERLIREISYGNSPVLVRFPSEGARILLNGELGAAEWDALSGEEVTSWGLDRKPPPSAITAGMRSGNGRFLCVGDFRGFLHWLDLRMPETLETGAGHKHIVSGLAWSPDDRLVCSVSEDGTLAIWQAFAYQPSTIFKAHMQGAHDVAFFPDGRRLVTTGSGREALKVWDLATQRELLSLPAEGSILQQLIVSPDGNCITAQDNQRRVYFWHAPSWEEIEPAEKTPLRQ
jgi:eukaryotic-like serine/threonine-protein kinase